MKALLLASPLSYPAAMDIPPRHPPFVLLSAAASLEAAGVTVEVYDPFLARADAAALHGAVEAGRPDVICYAPMDLQRFPPVEVVVQVAAAVTAAHPDVPMVLFGVRQGGTIDRLLQAVPGIICAVLGDPEDALAEVLGALEAGDAIDGVTGLRLRGPDGALRSTGAPRRIDDLDRLPTPAWHLVDLPRYTSPPHRRRLRRVLPILVSRSCPWNRCTFCQEFSTLKLAPYRVRSPEDVVAEIAAADHPGEELEVQFLDSTLPTDRPWLEGFRAALRGRSLSVTWSCLARVDQLDRETVFLMRELGCWNISFGIESSSQRTLDALAKGTTPERVRRTVAWCNEAGITATGTFMVGMPHERPRDVLRTARFAVDIGLDFAVFFISKWYERPPEMEALGTFLDEWDYSSFDFRGPPFIPAAYRDLDHLRRTQSLAHLFFYGHPKTMARRLKSLRTLDDLGNALSGLRTLLKIIS
jgi:anaerobic magnesium-protoporphyrin IX monomethyl ester cyclase